MFSGFAGLIMAAIEYVLYQQEIIINDFTSVSGGLPAIMLVTVLVWLIAGVLIAMVKS
jgi:tRNA G37 N-methylase TrmD